MLTDARANSAGPLTDELLRMGCFRKCLQVKEVNIMKRTSLTVMALCATLFCAGAALAGQQQNGNQR